MRLNGRKESLASLEARVLHFFQTCALILHLNKHL